MRMRTVVRQGNSGLPRDGRKQDEGHLSGNLLTVPFGEPGALL